MRLIQKIFEDNWEGFVKEIGYENIWEICHEEAEKIINCGKFENGYLEYTCEFCGEVKKVGFTCKSRLIKTYGYDPKRCRNCGKTMELTDIYYKKYGSVLEYWENRMLKEAKEAIIELEEKVKITNYIYRKELDIYYE